MQYSIYCICRIACLARCIHNQTQVYFCGASCVSAQVDLSPRELQIAQAYAQGENYQQIADRLCLAPSTVRTHLATIYRKIGVSSKLDLRDALNAVAAVPQVLAANHRQRPEKPSIAVLAFENMSGDPEQEYFSDGISDDIITALSRSPWLFIIARNTTFTYKGSNVDVRRVAEDLGVRFVLEGSVRRSGDKIRVTAQLIDRLTGGHVWSERYDGQLKDVFDLQDEITRNVVGSIQTTVHLSTIQEPVERATQLDERNEYAHWALGISCWGLLKYDESHAALERAVALNPNCSLAYGSLGTLLGIIGRSEEAIVNQEIAIRSNPLDPSIFFRFSGLAMAHYMAGRYELAIEWAERAIYRMPRWYFAYFILAASQVRWIDTNRP
jgi:TolB-like protein/DNA-binding CsgD family transcriptional regulator